MTTKQLINFQIYNGGGNNRRIRLVSRDAKFQIEANNFIKGKLLLDSSGNDIGEYYEGEQEYFYYEDGDFDTTYGRYVSDLSDLSDEELTAYRKSSINYLYDFEGIEFDIQFGGFYNSCHDVRIDDEIIEGDYDLEDVDIRKTYESYGRGWLEVAVYELDLEGYGIDFKEIYSPKYYNYTTDTIVASISQVEYANIKRDYLDDAQFVDYVNENSKSYDGFSSFYVGIDAVCEEPSIFLQYLLSYLLEENSVCEYEVEFDIVTK